MNRVKEVIRTVVHQISGVIARENSEARKTPTQRNRRYFT